MSNLDLLCSNWCIILGSTWHVLVSELDVDDVISWFSGAVCDLAGAVLLVLSVDVHFAGALDGQTQAAVA